MATLKPSGTEDYRPPPSKKKRQQQQKKVDFFFDCLADLSVTRGRNGENNEASPKRKKTEAQRVPETFQGHTIDWNVDDKITTATARRDVDCNDLGVLGWRRRRRRCFRIAEPLAEDRFRVGDASTKQKTSDNETR